MVTKFFNISTDGTLSENSNILVPSQKAVRNFIASKSIQLDYMQSSQPSTATNGNKWLNTSNNLLYTYNNSWDAGILIEKDQFFTFNDLLYYYDGSEIKNYSTLSITEQNHGNQIKLWVGTREEYNDLDSDEIDPNTIYRISDESDNYAILATQTQFDNNSQITAATPYQVNQKFGNYLQLSGGNLDAGAILRLTNTNSEVTALAFNTSGQLTISSNIYGASQLDINSIVVRNGNIYKTNTSGATALWSDSNISSTQLPTASTTDLGAVKIDGTTITINNGVISASGSLMGKSIGEVYYSQSSSAQDNPGGLPLFTGETIANADNLYPQFYQWVATHNELQISAADYETAITTYGECPKYVIDTANKTIRLPKLTNYVKMANTTDGITQSGAGLPNITGHCSEGPNATVDGAFSRYGAEIANAGGGGTVHVEYQGDFDASRSSAIYGASNTVTPAHTTLYPWVCAYNAAIPASTAQAAEFQQALTGKADTNLSNVTGTSGFRKLVEVYSNGASWYKVFDEYDPVTGTFIGKWCEQGGKISESYATVALLKEMADTNYSVLITVDRSTPPSNQEGNGSGYASSTTQIFVSSGTMYNGAFWRVSGYAATGA